MEFKNRKSVSEKLSKFMYTSNDSDFIEVTEWTNGEGYDICINDNKTISLHRDELEAINYLTKVLEYDFEE